MDLPLYDCCCRPVKKHLLIDVDLWSPELDVIDVLDDKTFYYITLNAKLSFSHTFKQQLNNIA